MFIFFFFLFIIVSINRRSNINNSLWLNYTVFAMILLVGLCLLSCNGKNNCFFKYWFLLFFLFIFFLTRKFGLHWLNLNHVCKSSGASATNSLIQVHKWRRSNYVCHLLHDIFFCNYVKVYYWFFFFIFSIFLYNAIFFHLMHNIFFDNKLIRILVPSTVILAISQSKTPYTLS